MSRSLSLRGFTLIELLATVTIIVLLMALVMPVIGMVSASTKTARCAANGRQLAAGMFAHAQDWHGRTIPWENNGVWWAETVKEYMEVNQAMIGTGTSLSKRGLNVLGDCPDWRPKSGSSPYSLTQRDAKSLGMAYNQRPLRGLDGSWIINGAGWGTGSKFVRLAEITHPEQRIAFWDANQHDENALPSQTNLYASWWSPAIPGSDSWCQWMWRARHRGRPNYVVFSGRVVSVRTEEQKFWNNPDALYQKSGDWLQYTWVQNQTNALGVRSAYWSGLNRPDQATY